MPITLKILLLLNGFLSALISGLFYSYSCSVNPGLNRLSDTEYLGAMQSINRAILNPWFFLSFLGTLIMLPVSAWMLYRYEAGSTSFYLLLGAALIYLIGVFGVTIFRNVPLNERLDKFNIGGASDEMIKIQRMQFEISWNRFHLIRTIACVVSLLLSLAAIVVKLPAAQE